LPNLDLYPFINKIELKNVDAKYQVEVRYWKNVYLRVSE
jgi:hypothetical protein